MEFYRRAWMCLRLMDWAQWAMARTARTNMY